MDVLLNNIEDTARASDFAEKTNTSEVWTKLGNHYLENVEKNQVVEAIDAYIKAKDGSKYGMVI